MKLVVAVVHDLTVSLTYDTLITSTLYLFFFFKENVKTDTQNNCPISHHQIPEEYSPGAVVRIQKYPPQCYTTAQYGNLPIHVFTTAHYALNNN